MRRGLRELAAARLLAEDTPGGGHKPRHALLAEAVAAALLPGERAELHERTARVLSGTGDPALAAEAAGHWAAACRPAEELPARVAAAEAPSGCSVTLTADRLDPEQRGQCRRSWKIPSLDR